MLNTKDIVDTMDGVIDLDEINSYENVKKVVVVNAQTNTEWESTWMAYNEDLDQFEIFIDEPQLEW